MHVAAIIPAAGRGERLGARQPKALVQLAGRPLVGWCLETLDSVDSIGSVVVAAPRGEEERLLGVCARFVRRARLTIVSGGESRSESVRNALDSIAQTAEDAVVVHDAARPLLTVGLVSGALRLLVSDPGLDAVICAARVTDTIKSVDREGIVERTLDRSRLRAVQTPQVFRRAAIRLAVESAGTSGLQRATDDAALVEQAGGTVAVHEAPPGNIKVTTPFDVLVAECLLADRVGRDGAGARRAERPAGRC